MLRISITCTDESTTLHLEGSVSGPWVDELKQLAEAILEDSKTLVVDCRGVSFGDFHGQGLIRELVARKARLINCSPFFTSQLEGGFMA